MPTRTYPLDWSGSRAITLSQEKVGTPLTVSQNDHIVGTLATPEELSAGRDFTLDDGSTITVRMVEKRVQVRRNGLLLLERWFAAPLQGGTSVRQDRVTRRITLICASLALGMGLISLFLVFNEFSNALAVAKSTYTPLLFCDACSSSPASPQPSPSMLPAAIFALGYGLFSSIAFLVGMWHAIANRAWGWAAFGFPLPLLLGIILLALLFLSSNRLDFTEWLIYLLLFFLLVVAALSWPLVSLIYARSLRSGSAAEEERMKG
ncbi:MAG TPA: hypothetical protein VH590_00105 [Ktedonobacterales bacterium]